LRFRVRVRIKVRVSVSFRVRVRAGVSVNTFLIKRVEVGTMKLIRTLDYTVIRKHNITYTTVRTLELEISERLSHFGIDFTALRHREGLNKRSTFFDLRADFTSSKLK